MKKFTALFLTMFIIIFAGCTQAKFDNKFIDNKIIDTTSANETVATTKKATQPTTEATTTKETIDKNKKMIAFTFDDGPSQNTERILDVFKKYNGKATFFVVGENIENNTDILKRIVDEGHELGSHTWSHTNLSNLDSNGIINDYNKMKDKIYEYTDYEISTLRPPYGSHNDTVKSTCESLKTGIIMWDVDTLDWQSRDAGSVANVINQQASDGSIVLCHDLYESTADAIERVIPGFVEEGYQLVTVSELLSVDTGEVELGVGHYSRNEAY